MWNLPRPGIEPVSPVLAGGFLITGLPGKSPSFLFSAFHVLLLQQTFIQRARHHPGCGETEVSLFTAWWKTTRDVNRWFPASLEHGEGPHPGGPPSTRDSSLSDTQSACCNDGKTQKFLGTEQLRSGKKEKNKTKNMPERLLGGIINVLLRRKILVCVSRHANTSANKATQRKQV